jgi:hypothetical protein
MVVNTPITRPLSSGGAVRSVCAIAALQRTGCALPLRRIAAVGDGTPVASLPIKEAS